MNYNEIKNAVKQMDRLHGVKYIKDTAGLSLKDSIDLFDKMKKEGFDNYDYSILDGDEFKKQLDDLVSWPYSKDKNIKLKEWIKEHFIPKH